MLIYISPDPAERTWRTTAPYTSRRTESLAEDAIVVHNREPWRVWEVRPIPADSRWPAIFEEGWNRARLEAVRPLLRSRWHGRPVSVLMAPDPVDGSRPLRSEALICLTPASHHWHVLEEHYPVCRRCGELPPCLHSINEASVAYHAERAEFLMALGPADCHGCGKPVTARHKSHIVEGPNRWRPDLGPDTAVFHTRAESECVDWLRIYLRQADDERAAHSDAEPSG